MGESFINILLLFMEMGRVKTQLIKRTGREIAAKHKDVLTADFHENRKRILQIAEIRSKKLRNAIAGYATRLVKEH